MYFAVTYVGLGTFHVTGAASPSARTGYVPHGRGADGEGVLLINWNGGHRSVLRISAFTWPVSERAPDIPGGDRAIVGLGNYERMDGSLRMQRSLPPSGLLRITVAGGEAIRSADAVPHHVFGTLSLVAGDC